ncbi:hypothetical protein CRE_19814 [Caenorhabditis remanei]|uniref:CUB-like domain-containing protein n=1 Tax=Caenorhabditis remanei TaxID=31234 RepID=E3MTF7_CAERE|nr:hypothetical protein CRE_19814 [Caenorhabditis remanei]
MFSNPMTINGSDVFFSNVEQFSLTSSAFYMKTFYGGPNFIIRPSYFNIDGSVTTAYTTTGFYAKAVGDDDSVKTIRTLRQLGSSGFTGANIIGTLPNGGNVTVGEYDGNSHHTFTVQASNFSWNTPFFSWNAPFIGENFRMSSSGTQRGEFFVQYFVHQGPLKEIPTTATPTTQSIQTTTKSCGTNSLILSLGFVVFLSGF